jgi:uncharacterized protein YggE
MRKTYALLVFPLLLAGCGGGGHDARGVKPGETLLQVSATGEAKAQPDQASSPPVWGQPLWTLRTRQPRL